MSTPPGWEPRPGPTRGDPARRAPRGPASLARDDAKPRRQGERGGSPAGGRGWEEGPSFTPGRAPSPRDGGPNGPRPQRGGPGRPAQKADGYERRGPRADDFGGRPRSSGEGRVVDRGGPASDLLGFDGFRSGGPARWLGRMPTWSAMLLLAVGTVLGIIVTLVAGQEPGGLLGFFIIVGAVAAALCIRRGKVYLLFPAPALAFFVAAVVTGKVHDAKLGSSTAGLASGFTQWIAGMFFPAVVATIIVVLIGGGRWLLGRQLISGQSPLTAGGRPAAGNPRPGPRDRRPAVDSWAADNSFDNPVPRTSPTGPTPRQSGTGPAPRQAGTGPTPRQGGTGPAPRQGGTGPAPVRAEPAQLPGRAGPAQPPSRATPPGRAAPPTATARPARPVTPALTATRGVTPASRPIPQRDLARARTARAVRLPSPATAPPAPPGTPAQTRAPRARPAANPQRAGPSANCGRMKAHRLRRLLRPMTRIAQRRAASKFPTSALPAIIVRVLRVIDVQNSHDNETGTDFPGQNGHGKAHATRSQQCVHPKTPRSTLAAQPQRATRTSDGKTPAKRPEQCQSVLEAAGIGPALQPRSGPLVA